MFENEDVTPRWKEGKSVAYCETCFKETMKRRESSEGQDVGYSLSEWRLGILKANGVKSNHRRPKLITRFCNA